MDATQQVTTQTAEPQTQVKQDFWTGSQTPIGGVFVLSVMLIAGFVVLARRIDKESPLAPHILPLAGVMIVIPATMFMGITKIIGSEVVAAILASIVTFFFATKPNIGDTSTSQGDAPGTSTSPEKTAKSLGQEQQGP